MATNRSPLAQFFLPTKTTVMPSEVEASLRPPVFGCAVAENQAMAWQVTLLALRLSAPTITTSEFPGVVGIWVCLIRGDVFGRTDRIGCGQTQGSLGTEASRYARRPGSG